MKDQRDFSVSPYNCPQCNPSRLGHSKHCLDTAQPGRRLRSGVAGGWSGDGEEEDAVF